MLLIALNLEIGLATAVSIIITVLTLSYVSKSNELRAAKKLLGSQQPLLTLTEHLTKRLSHLDILTYAILEYLHAEERVALPFPNNLDGVYGNDHVMKLRLDYLKDMGFIQYRTGEYKLTDVGNAFRLWIQQQVNSRTPIVLYHQSRPRNVLEFLSKFTEVSSNVHRSP